MNHILAFSLAFLWSLSATALCVPVGLDQLAEPVTTFARVLVVPDAHEPYAIISCGLSRVEGTGEVRVPLTQPVPASPIALDSDWDRLWAETAPEVIARPAPEVGRPLPSTDSPERLITRQYAANPAPDGRVEVVELDVVTEFAAESTSSVLTFRLYTGGPFDISEPTWLPAARIPLVVTEAGLTLPVSILAQESARVTIMIVTHDSLFAPAGSDAFSALARLNDVGAGPVDGVSTPIILPDQRVGYSTTRVDGFEGLYTRRANEQRDGPSAVAVLHYAGPMVGGHGWPIAPTLSSAPHANRALRFEVLGAWLDPFVVAPVSNFWFRATWVSLEAPSDETDAPTQEELTLDGDSLLFAMGAEAPAELTPGLIRPFLQGRQNDLLACAPRRLGTYPGEVALVVEPGGRALAAFAQFEEQSVANCLVETLREMHYPIATGPPILIRFPLEVLGRAE